MIRPRSLGYFVVVALLGTGCAESSSSPTAPSSPVSPSSSTGGRSSSSGLAAVSADQLAGTWTLQSLQPAGESDRNTPAGANYTVTFADGRLQTRVDCNQCGGAFTLSGQTLTAGPLMACTRAACPTMEFETIYIRLLSGDSTVTVTSGTLVLSSSRGVLRFTR